MKSAKHEQIIRERNTRSHRIIVFIRQIIVIVLIVVGIWELNKNRDILASLTFLWAAIAISIQHFISSFFAFFYIRGKNEFDIGDIIRVWSGTLPFSGEVRRIWLFFTSLREVDDELMYTGKIVSFPNNQIFTGGISNFTKRDLLFWHQFSIVIQIGNQKLESIHKTLTNIIDNLYNKLLEEDLYEESQARTSKPKIRLEITEQGIKVYVRILVHFYRVWETNNAFMIAITEAHQAGKIQLLKLKDCDWIQMV